jgi:hypothetical protein
VKFVNIKPALDGAPYQFANVPFTPDSDAGTLAFQTVAMGDATALFDGVAIVQRDAGQLAVVTPALKRAELLSVTASSSTKAWPAGRRPGRTE